MPVVLLIIVGVIAAALKMTAARMGAGDLRDLLILFSPLLHIYCTKSEGNDLCIGARGMLVKVIHSSHRTAGD